MKGADHWSKIVWITVDQTNRRILSQSGFIISSDALRSKQSWINDPFADFPKETHPKENISNESWTSCNSSNMLNNFINLVFSRYYDQRLHALC